MGTVGWMLVVLWPVMMSSSCQTMPRTFRQSRLPNTQDMETEYEIADSVYVTCGATDVALARQSSQKELRARWAQETVERSTVNVRCFAER